jgi:hypothetical protein
MSRRVNQLIWLAMFGALLNTISMSAAAAKAELRIDAAPSAGLRLDIATEHSWAAPLALNATDSPAQAPETTEAPETAETSEIAEKEEPPPFPWRVVPPDTPDFRGAARDTAYFMVFQLAVIGLLYVAPESVSNWSDEDKENYDSDKWQENVSNPQRDTDDFFINYVLHPYWGATYYIRGRERGFSRPQSFFFSFGLSFLYEFGFESMFENPSYQDLWTTPVIGSLVGEFWFSGVRDRIKAKPGELNWKDKTVLFLTDPLGVLSSATDRLLGIDSNVTVKTFDTAAPLRVAGSSTNANPMSTAFLPVRTQPALGLQLQLKW